jgi:hypothetical protein
MKPFKEVWSKGKTEVLEFAKNFTKELKTTGYATADFAGIYGRRAGASVVKTFSKKENIAMTIAFSASILCAAVIVGANYNARKVTLSENRVEATQILGNEKQVATNTIFKQEKKKPVGSAIVREDIFTRSNAAYTMENRELLAQMMFAEEGVFFSWYANDPDTIERAHKLAGSVILHRLNTHFSGAQTLADVLYAPGQYDYRTIQRVEEGRTLPAQVYVWADELLLEGAIGPDTLVFQAEFPQGSEVYDHIANQYFCCR